MQIKVVVHEEEEGGYWAEVPAIPGCASQGDTMEEGGPILEGERWGGDHIRSRLSRARASAGAARARLR